MAMRSKAKPPKKRTRATRKQGDRRESVKANPETSSSSLVRRADPSAALSAFARRIVKVTTAGGDYLSHLSLYSPDAVSTEPSFGVTRGLEALAEKAKSWQQIQESVSWKARNVCLDPRSGMTSSQSQADAVSRGSPA